MRGRHMFAGGTAVMVWSADMWLMAGAAARVVQRFTHAPCLALLLSLLLLHTQLLWGLVHTEVNQVDRRHSVAVRFGCKASTVR
jgi:hypothetical protein